jgi:magnesium-transporting ATPase (P-type)
MVQEPALRGVIDFLARIGIYDVVLPFLLVFTLVYAILEKTKVLGMEEVEGKKYTRKNLNAIIAFVIALLVIASTKLVATINQILANTVLLLILAVFFLLLVGSFFKSEGEVFLKGGWNLTFMIIMFIGILLIFFHALGWLQKVWDYLSSNLSSQVVGGLILVVIIIIAIVFITHEKKPESKPKE